MKSTKVEPLKTTIVTFIILVLVAFLAVTIVVANAQYAHADELREAHQFVGGPASEVLKAYGEPDGWAYFNADSSKDLSQGIWYYGDIEFHLLYANDVNPEGIICGVSER